MLYLSKGYLKNRSVGEIGIFHAGRKIFLKDREAALWLKGRDGFAVTDSETEEMLVRSLAHRGLAEYEEKQGNISRYRILTRGIVYPLHKRGRASSRLGGGEQEILTWLRKAGIRLSVAELVFLAENRMKAEPEFLTEQNRYRLVMAIYADTSVGNSTLEQQMEQSGSRDRVVDVLMMLLEKRRIVFV